MFAFIVVAGELSSRHLVSGCLQVAWRGWARSVIERCSHLLVRYTNRLCNRLCAAMTATGAIGESVLAASQPPRERRGTMFASLAIRDYRYLWVANLGATFAMQMSVVGRGWLVYAMTGSAVQLAWVMIAFLAPTVVFSLLGGALADRVRKRTVMVVSQALNCLSTVALAMIILSEQIAYWHFIAFGLFNGIILSLAMPSRQAIIPEIVGERGIFNAMALSAASMNLSRVVGPAAAGVIIALVAGGDTGSQFGVGIVFCIIAALYGLASVATMLLGHDGAPEARERGSVFAETAKGLHYIAGDLRLRALLLTAFATMLFGMPMQFLMPAFNEDVLAGGPDALGWLMGAMGAGAIIGSLLLARMEDTRNKGRLMLITALAWGGSSAAFALSFSIELALLLAAATGLFSSMFMSLIMSLIQLTSAHAMRGRVMSVTMLIWGLMPLGVLPISFFAESFGIAAALLLSAALMVVLTLLLALRFPVLVRIDRGGARDFADETA